MKSLLDKLAKLKNPMLIEGLREDLLGLEKDFVELALLKCRVYMKQVRELVLEIEDWVDQKADTPDTVWVDQKADTPDTVKIKYFEDKIKGAHERFTWYYDLLKIVPTEPDVVLDHAPSKIIMKRPPPVEEKPCHGILDGPRDELLKHLTDDKEEMLKVVSVVGREGLGKTTLAKEIYSVLQVGRLFECQAFVSVGQRPAMREILNDILRQVKPGSGIFSEVPRVITELREYLDTKRYFILVDGIWSTWAWKVITCALPNNRGSRVMTTTCIIHVASSCSSYPNDLVYQMESLRDKNSKILFHSRMTRQVERIADFEEVCGDMLLNMCGGMPLGIIIAADLLARKSEDPTELKMLGKFILSSLKQYSTSDGMTKILHMSYADLSLPLRSCLLYLSVFQENYTITKDRLIRLWGAEGFIPKTDKKCLWETGEMFFNELIIRRLIQPVFKFDDDQAVGCTVHTVILDFIRSISREENFATRATELNSGPFPCDTIRRFSLDCGNEDEADTLSTNIVHLSSLRSLTVFGDVRKLDPPDSSADDERISDPQRLPSDSKQNEEMHAAMGFGARMRRRLGSRTRSRRAIKDVEVKLDPPDSPADPESMSYHEFLPSDSEQGEEMHATEAPGVGIMDQPSRRPGEFEDVEEKLDPPDSPTDDKSISDHEGLPSDSTQGEDMRASEAPGFGVMDQPSRPPGVFGDVEEKHETPGVPMFNLSAFKLVRVLDLEDTKNLENKHLEGIGGLVLLRYLGLAGTGITQLPEEIGGLEQLETLDLRRNIRLTTLPASRVKLQKMRHLLLPGYAEKIWEMPELEEASGIRVERSSSLGTVIELLRKSEQLRMLGLILKVKPNPTETDLDLVSFVNEIVKSKLQSLSIEFRSDRDREIVIPIPQLVDSWERVTIPLAKKFEPQRFEIRIKTEGLRRVPPNMGSLAILTHLFIIVDQAKAEDFLVLGGLTNLVLLDLITYKSSETEWFIIKGGFFPRLKVFSFKIRDTWMGLEFEEGAMPQLQRFGRSLRVTEPMNQPYPDIGVEHLTCLTRVHAIFNCQDATVSQVEELEAAIRRQVSEIASKPALELSREYETSMRL